MEGTKAEEHISTFKAATIKMTTAKNNDAERKRGARKPLAREESGVDGYISDITLSVTSTLNTAYIVKKPVTLQQGRD